MDEERLITKLIRTCGTNNPFAIAEHRNILVLYEQLGKHIWGYFSNAYRIPIIHINEDLNEFERTFTAAHELGHCLLHAKLNTPFLRRNTLISVDRIEQEANRFAIKLLIGQAKPEPGETAKFFLLRCGIPEWVHPYFAGEQPDGKSSWSAFCMDDQSFWGC
ncbi:ImmA/IrrE family metallo-endopeptidase [Paenibacillus pinistramenti]|uniref:ImmA/IrrE family metallo-endopeptidase n=1 Tax=Paenibacillus pinistramenti TaxID=1768003 RepID=UPI001108799C|nr:ImmA/IrrE family metallo-endopeptidase [Paenibacillus pinistramenti]